jgi:hypothetical protein
MVTYCAPIEQDRVSGSYEYVSSTVDAAAAMGSESRTDSLGWQQVYILVRGDSIVTAALAPEENLPLAPAPPYRSIYSGPVAQPRQLSELKLHRELNLPRGSVGGGNDGRRSIRVDLVQGAACDSTTGAGARSDRGAWGAVVDMVWDIEELRPELHLPAFSQMAHSGVFYQREVKIVVTWTPQEVARHVPDESRRLNGKRARIVP